MNMMAPSIVGNSVQRDAAEEERKHAIRRCKAALAKVTWYRRVARQPHLFHLADGSPVTRAYARNIAYDFLADARSWRNVIRA